MRNLENRVKMKIGIIVAMSKELRLLVNLLEDRREETVNGSLFAVGRIGRHEVCMMQCGIGKVNAAAGTLTMIQHCAPSLILNTGVAGGAGDGVRQMDIVVGERIAYHDVWCGPGTEYGQVQGLPRFFRSDERLVRLASEMEDGTVRNGLICSGDKFIDSPAQVEEIKRNFPDVAAVDMESGAIAQICYQRQVPVFVMRVISDTPGSAADNTSQYENFWETAPEHTFEAVCRLIDRL